jgi:hypothetical protein
MYRAGCCWSASPSKSVGRECGCRGVGQGDLIIVYSSLLNADRPEPPGLNREASMTNPAVAQGSTGDYSVRLDSSSAALGTELVR